MLTSAEWGTAKVRHLTNLVDKRAKDGEVLVFKDGAKEKMAVLSSTSPIVSA